MEYAVQIATALLVALLVGMMVFPIVLRYAREHNIVDNPNARKLQRHPVPILGGVVVFTGLLAGGLTLIVSMPTGAFCQVIPWMAVMLVMGTWDDISELGVGLRFSVEVLTVLAVMATTGWQIDSLHGLMGIWRLHDVVSTLLSVVAGVGIVNAINLIDGVDGYSSGYGIMACTCFATLFFVAGDAQLGAMGLVMAASLLPFFVHNVFGVKTKMFIGDGGTLMLGMLMAVMVFATLSTDGPCSHLEERQVGLLAFALAVLSIPVFDTLRVMTMRMASGRSPFRPDKTHLHHLFIDMGFSHLGAAVSILSLNVGVLAVWVALWLCGVSVEVQGLAVVLMGVFVTVGLYELMKRQQAGGPMGANGLPVGTVLWRQACRLGEWTHKERSTGWKVIRKMVDSKLLGGTKK